MDFKKFRQKFIALTDFEQDFLKIMSLAYEPVNQTTLVSLLNECDIKTAHGIQFNGTIVKGCWQKLSDDWLSFRKENKVEIKPKLTEWVMRMVAVDKRFDEWVRGVQGEMPYREWHRPMSFGAAIRELRMALYQNRIIGITDILRDIDMYYPIKFGESKFFEKFFHPFSPKWLATFPSSIQNIALEQLVREAVINLKPVDEYVNFMLESSHLDDVENGKMVRSLLRDIFLLQGKLAETAELLTKEKDPVQLNIGAAWINFLKGENKLALNYFEDALRKHRKVVGSRVYFDGVEGLFHILSLMKQKGKDFHKKVHVYTDNIDSANYEDSFNYLKSAIYFLQNLPNDAQYYLKSNPTHPLGLVFKSVVGYWNQNQFKGSFFTYLLDYYSRAKRHGYDWMAMEFVGVLGKVYPKEELRQAFGKEWIESQQKMGIVSILPIVEFREKWQRSLDALLGLKGTRRGSGSGKLAKKSSRLVWLVDFEGQEIQPKEQTLNKSGGWSKGRNVALKRLKEGGVKSMTEQDMKMVSAVKMYTGWGYYGGSDYFIDFDKGVKALVGHPFVFRMDSPGVAVEISEKQPELIVEERKGYFEVRFNESFFEAGSYLLKETPTRYHILEVTKKHEEINRLLENGHLKIPEKGKDKLVEVIGNLSSIVTVQSAVGDQGDIPTVDSDSKIYVHLLPIGDGFKLEFFVKPFDKEPPYFKPGSGRENVMAEVNGIPTQTKRELKKERENSKRVEDACPSLQKVESYNREWHFEEVTDCLNVLLELEPLRQNEQIVLEHPKGEKLKIAGQLDFNSLSLGIKKDRDWFGLTGKVKVDDKKVIDFRRLLEMVEESDTRFVEISEGQFLALTDQLRKRVLELNSLLSKTKKEMRFHPLAAPVLDEFSDILGGFKVDLAWKKHLKRITEAKNIKPTVPSTFKAQLREYQMEGFNWLSQLAYWGVGACLADDMGLGKTIQGLAALVDRAKEGPGLVVAPASVARNWLRETEKFAPTLRPILFGSGDRKKIVKDLKPFDLLICSYGLMQSEGDLLSETEFNTIILDEAQAIKNRSTKRSKAAMALKGNFKIITTGTPIENHLGELWNLFNFLNPGLMGSLERFNETYAIPIEKYRDNDRRNQLRRLIQPFILRRRKSEVLDELPAKTEITLTVDLTDEERSFYEALRQKALDNISGLEEGGQKRFAILAELMRLRQACCNPRLVVPGTKVTSSKLTLFAEVVQELLENGHKALIFSQFVKHLRLVEEWVQKNNIAYQYLDGQTSLPKREKAINAFQGGEGDLFLISLKAGGTGLNLTAADYVIHLDPWWNPAVEDQASDRAHRIGQKRSVTIYRLVTENTIEEKIVQLHGEKRDLADSLLEGTESSAKLNPNELLDLIKGG